MLSKYGVARHVYINIPKAGSANHAVGADWTPAAGDVKISKDGGAAANVTNLPTAIAMGNSAIWDFSLTATEMQAAIINITVSDSATKAVDDTGFLIETYGNASAQHAADLDDPVRLGLTALPNAAADAAGGLPISDAGGLDLDAQIGTKINDILTDTGTTLQAELDGIQADTEDIQSRLPAALSSGKMPAVVSDVLDVNVVTVNDEPAEQALTDGSGNAMAKLADIATHGGASTVITADLTGDLSALTATVADSVPADGTRPSIAQACYMIAQYLTEKSISGTTLTVNKPDGSTALFTLTLNSATAPTAATRAT